MSEGPVFRPIEPVASELVEWKLRAEKGDEVARRAVMYKDPVSITELRLAFIAFRSSSY